jgi:cephalosporin hydroxylase
MNLIGGLGWRYRKLQRLLQELEPLRQRRDRDRRRRINDFFELLVQTTGNFRTTRWLGQPVWQNVLDLWTIQETLFELAPALVIECGTNRGGSAYFYACLFDLMRKGEVLTCDIEKMHELSHSRIEWIIGSSISEPVVARARERASGAGGPVMVILDSDHARSHVLREMELYSSLVTPGSFLLVQDGVIDTLEMFGSGRPGPLRAIEAFLATHSEFEADVGRSDRFLITHHPMGWLRRRALSQ